MPWISLNLTHCYFVSNPEPEPEPDRGLPGDTLDCRGAKEMINALAFSAEKLHHYRI